MTANPEQSAEEKVKQRRPGAKCVSDIWQYYIGIQRSPDYIERLSVPCWTETEAWLDAASRLEAEHE